MVLFDPAPAMTGIRPAAAFTTSADCFVLGVGQCGRFTRGTDRHQTVRPFGDMPFNQFLERVQIQRAVRERRDECR